MVYFQIAAARGRSGRRIYWCRRDSGSNSNGVSKKRVGLAIVGRVPAREGAVLENDAGEEVGVVTSGGFGPSLGAPVAMAMINTGFNAVGTVLNARVRGKRVPVEVAKMPFVPQNYFRG